MTGYIPMETRRLRIGFSPSFQLLISAALLIQTVLCDVAVPIQTWLIDPEQSGDTIQMTDIDSRYCSNERCDPDIIYALYIHSKGD